MIETSKKKKLNRVETNYRKAGVVTCYVLYYAPNGLKSDFLTSQVSSNLKNNASFDDFENKGTEMTYGKFFKLMQKEGYLTSQLERRDYAQPVRRYKLTLKGQNFMEKNHVLDEIKRLQAQGYPIDYLEETLEGMILDTEIAFDDFNQGIITEAEYIKRLEDLDNKESYRRFVMGLYGQIIDRFDFSGVTEDDII